MRVGLALPQYDFSVGGAELTWASVAEWAATAETVGLESVWLADHLFLSIEKYGARAGDHEGLEPLVTLAAVAAVTDRVRIGTLVLCAPLRAPSVMAKMIATVDVLSAGRVEVGIGAGWYEPEFVAAGIPFEAPGARLAHLEEAVGLLDRSLTGNGPPLRPGPIQRPRPPIFVGGRGDRLLDLVARCADGWNTVWSVTPDQYRARARVLDAACDRAGRDATTVERSVGLYTLVGENERDLQQRFARLKEVTPRGTVPEGSVDEWREGHLVGTVEQVKEQLATWHDLGVARIISCLSAVPFGVTSPDDLEPLASAAAT